MANPELAYLKEHYRAAFQGALNEAVRALTDEQFNLLKLQVVDGIRTGQLATLFGVDRATIKRRLAAARALLFDAMRARLQEQLRLSPSEFESVVGLVRSQLHLSLRGEGRPAAPAR